MTGVRRVADRGLALIREGAEQDKQHAGLQNNRLKNGTPRGIIVCQDLSRGLRPASSASALRFPSVATATSTAGAGVGRRRATQHARVQSPDSGRESVERRDRTATKRQHLDYWPHGNRRTAATQFEPRGSAPVANSVTYAVDKPYVALRNSSRRGCEA